MGGNPHVRVRPDDLDRIDAQKRVNETRADVLNRALDSLESDGVHVDLTVDGLHTATTLSAASGTSTGSA